MSLRVIFLLFLVALGASHVASRTSAARRSAGDVADVAARYIEMSEHYIDAPDQMAIKLYAKKFLAKRSPKKKIRYDSVFT
jgi:Flp pilus assembly protein TadG